VQIKLEDYFGNTIGTLELPSFEVADEEEDEGYKTIGNGERVIRVQSDTHIDNSGRATEYEKYLDTKISEKWQKMMLHFKHFPPVYKVYDEDGIFCIGTIIDIIESLNTYFADSRNQTICDEDLNKATEENWEKCLEDLDYSFMQLNKAHSNNLKNKEENI
jgi:hypothetical protein|tara:strand:- start:203 stop:685 length:483 start_codon:yes stop_codon:yes gene_type:complete